MRSDQVAAVGHDRIGILHHLEMLVPIITMKPHALANDLQHVDNAEGPLALMRAQFTMIGVIDGSEGVDFSGTGGFKLLALKLALVGVLCREGAALESDRRLSQVNQLKAGNCP